MYKIIKLFLLSFVMVACVSGANGATMCVNSDTVMVVLDPVLMNQSSGYDNDEMTFWGQFTYGRVSGQALCEKTKSDGTQSSTAIYCWCKLVKPVESKPVYRLNYSTANDCVNNCHIRCKNDISSEGIRTSLFRNIRVN